MDVRLTDAPQVRPGEADDARVGIPEPQKQARDRRFAAAAFTDNGQPFPPRSSDEDHRGQGVVRAHRRNSPLRRRCRHRAERTGWAVIPRPASREAAQASGGDPGLAEGLAGPGSGPAASNTPSSSRAAMASSGGSSSPASTAAAAITSRSTRARAVVARIRAPPSPPTRLVAAVHRSGDLRLD